MLRTLVIGTIFLSITIALLALQPAPRSDRFVAPVVSEAPAAPVVEEVAATRADTNLMTAPITVPTVPKPVAPKPIVAEVNTPSTPTTIKGLQELVSVALTQGMTGQEIDQLIVQAVDHGTLIIPDTLRTPNGQPDTMAMLATLVDATTPNTPTLTRNVRNTYVVRPGDSLASIAVKYYGSTDAVNDIFWANKDRLSDPDQLRVGQTIFLPLM
jgi:nucleoid-associated protein YgaU